MKFYKIFHNYDDTDENLIILYVTINEKSYSKDFFIVNEEMNHVDLQELAEHKLHEFYESIKQKQEVTQ
jgi:hypothetical protein